MKNHYQGKRLFAVQIIFLLSLLFISVDGLCQNRVRNEIKIPDINGYISLKCDFHLHTVFSDGSVWPTVRPEEAWREGLDVISLTDHIEYQPHKNDIPTNHNRSYEIAKPTSDNLGLILIKGTEITRDTPPGHHNALFVTEIDSLDTDEFYDVFEEGMEQGAFIFYNHPGWKHPEGKSEWFKYQEELYNKGHLHGIEVVNGKNYYPLAHQWCLDKKLTMVGNSDAHNPINLDYNFEKGEHRPLTLVFAKKRTEKAVKDALFAGRTAIWWKNYLIGREKYLRPLFNESVEIVNPNVRIFGNGRVSVQIHNSSDIDFKLEADGDPEYVTASRSIILYAGKTVILTLQKKPPEVKDDGKTVEVYGRKRIRIPYRVKNLLIAPGKGLPEDFSISVRFEKPEEK